MPTDALQCIVIGSGPGGYVAAIRAAQVGLRTAVIEREDVVGGRCLNTACIPAKAVLRSADVLSEIDHAADFGIRVPSREVDFAAVAARRAKVIETLTGGVAGLFKKNQIQVIRGAASRQPGASESSRAASGRWSDASDGSRPARANGAPNPPPRLRTRNGLANIGCNRAAVFSACLNWARRAVSPSTLEPM